MKEAALEVAATAEEVRVPEATTAMRAGLAREGAEMATVGVVAMEAVLGAELMVVVLMVEVSTGTARGVATMEGRKAVEREAGGKGATRVVPRVAAAKAAAAKAAVARAQEARERVEGAGRALARVVVARGEVAEVGAAAETVAVPRRQQQSRQTRRRCLRT